MHQSRTHWAWVWCGMLAVSAILFLLFSPWRRPDVWSTPDQYGDQLLREGRLAEAAQAYHDPERQGMAWYRAGEFKKAAAAFARGSSAEAAYNRGDALVMLGKYDDAIKSYDRALALRPNWKEAKENKALAIVRRDRIKKEGGEMTGGEVKPDEIVFEKGKAKPGAEEEVTAGAPLSDEALRAQWLLRVQTKPADFLKAKFAYQRQQQGGAP